MEKQEENNLENMISLYNSIGLETRNMNYLARWVYDIYKRLFYLPSINPIYNETLSLDKTKLAIFAILVDDLADNCNIRNSDLLEKAIRIPWNYKQKYNNPYLEATRNTWLNATNSIKKYPLYDELKEVFYFDIEQFLDAIKYSSLINTIDMDNEMESRIYSYHNMMIIVYMDMDLMCSPNFDMEELKIIRPIFHHIQEICHIGNVISTYKREINEVDLSCPIISRGIRNGLTTKEEIMNNPKNATEKLKPLEGYFMKKVEDDFRKIDESADEIKSVDIKKFSDKLRQVFDSFLKRQYYWENNVSLDKVL